MTSPATTAHGARSGKSAYGETHGEAVGRGGARSATPADDEIVPTHRAPSGEPTATLAYRRGAT